MKLLDENLNILDCIEETKELLVDGVTVGTSGTTGPSKVYHHKPSKLISYANLFREKHGFNENTKSIVYYRRDWIGGLVFLTLPVMLSGGTAHNTDQDHYNFIKILMTGKYNVCGMSPKGLTIFEKTKNWKDLDLTGITCYYGSDRTAFKGIETLLKKGATVVTTYGCSEVGPVILTHTYKNLDDLEKVKSMAIPGMTPIGYIDNCLCDIKISNGQVFLKGPCSLFGEEEWYPTGDLAQVNDDGFLWFNQRIKDAPTEWKLVK